MAEDQRGQSGAPFSVERQYVTGFNIIGSVSDVVLLAASPAAAMSPDGSLGAMLVPTVQLTMPWLACKELAAMLQSQVDAYEAEHGELTSAFLERHANGLPAVRR